MRAALRSALLAHAPTVAIAGDRINWGEHPQGAPRPYVVLQAVSDVEGMTLEARNGLAQTRVQVDCYAMTMKGAVDLAAAVQTRLFGYRAGAIRNVEYLTTRDGREGGANEADRPFRVSMDFLVHWRST
jgi:hypothetical protein